jgi:hypothetical protein
MSNVSGTISVNVEFRDTTTSSGVQSLKTVTLRDATEYTAGKVAIVTGTVGTSAISIATSPTAFRDSSGELVSFATLERIVFCATPSGRAGWNNTLLPSSNNQPAVCPILPAGPGSPTVVAITGTASYTLVIYGT